LGGGDAGGKTHKINLSRRQWGENENKVAISERGQRNKKKAEKRPRKDSNSEGAGLLPTFGLLGEITEKKKVVTRIGDIDRETKLLSLRQKKAALF